MRSVASAVDCQATAFERKTDNADTYVRHFHCHAGCIRTPRHIGLIQTTLIIIIYYYNEVRHIRATCNDDIDANKTNKETDRQTKISHLE